MKRIEKAQEILENIIINGRPYQIAVAHYFKDHYIVKNERLQIRKMVLNTLRNYLQYSTFVTESIPNLNFSETLFLIIVLADLQNDHFLTRTNAEEWSAIRLGSKVNSDLLNRFIGKACSEESLISPFLDKMGNDYLSLRYNIPRWLVGMWIKHYGRVVALKILKSLRTKEKKNYRVVNGVLDRNAIIALKDGIVAGVSETDVIVEDKVALVNHDYLQIGGLLPIKEGLNHLVNKMEFAGHEDALIIDEEMNNFALAFSLKHQKAGRILTAVVDDHGRLAMKKELEKYNINNNEIFTSKTTSLITYVSASVDRVVYIPHSSHFNAIRNEPDFFLHFKKEKIDEYLFAQKDGLNSASAFVKDGGTLLYAVLTMNNKEGTMQIRDFLANHPEFKLQEEKQLLPFEKRDTALYYAFLKKKVRKND